MRMSAAYDPVRKHLEVDFAGYVGDRGYAVCDGIIGETDCCIGTDRNGHRSMSVPAGDC